MDGLNILLCWYHSRYLLSLCLFVLFMIFFLEFKFRFINLFLSDLWFLCLSKEIFLYCIMSSESFKILSFTVRGLIHMVFIFWTVVLEKTLESPLDCKEIQPVHCEGDQPWDFFGRNDAEAETPVLWPPDAKSWLTGKDSDAGRDWGQEEKGTTEDEMAGWHHWLDGCESQWTPGVDDGQGGLECCDSWGCRVGHDWATDLIWSDLFFVFSVK